MQKLTSLYPEIGGNLDPNGLPMFELPNGQLDGGDSAHRAGIIVTCLYLLGHRNEAIAYYHKVIEAYTSAEHVYRRHPDTTKWYSDYRNMSRDQTTMLMSAMLVTFDKWRINGLMRRIVTEQGGMHDNIYHNYVIPTEKTAAKMPDIVVPAQLSKWIRVNNNWTQIFLPFLDAFLLIDILLCLWDDSKSKARGKRTDYHTMLLMDLMVASQIKATWVGKLAFKIYTRFVDWSGAINYIFNFPGEIPLDRLFHDTVQRCKQ